MIRAAFPAFLLGGALFATVPLVLHLLARRPPERQPLPTARFLSEEQRTFLRFSQKPSDVPLLLTRMLFAMVLGAGFAGLTWSTDRSGVLQIVLIDAEAAGTIGVDSLNAAAEIAIANGTENGLDVRIIGYAADESGALVTSPDLRDLVGAIGEPRPTAADGLRVLRSSLRSETAVAAVEVVWLLRPTWNQWTRGVGLLRAALWPGAADIIPMGPRSSVGGLASQDGSPTRVYTASLEGYEAEAVLPRAVVALGGEVITPEPGTAPGADWFFADSPSSASIGTLSARARAGATVVLSGTLPASTETTTVPWTADVVGTPSREAASSPLREIVLGAGQPPIAFSGQASSGAPAPGALVTAVFDDATPAVAAKAVDAGCIIFTSVSLRDPVLTASSGYVDFIDALVHACPTAPDDAPFDAGALAALARSDLPDRVALGDLDDSSGVPFTPALLLLALALLGAETVLTRRGRA